MSYDFFKQEIYLKKIDSTNNYLKSTHFDENIIIYTFNQTKGRGRRNKEWLDFKNKNLAVSFLIKSPLDPFWFICAASLSLIDLLKSLNIKKSWIKWPNDIYIDDKKLSGILAETIWYQGNIQRIIIGIGININNNIDDFVDLKSATSLYLATGKKQKLKMIYQNYKRELSRWLLELTENKNLDLISEKWKEASYISDKKIKWIINNEIISGNIHDIKEDGTLIIKSINNILYEVKTGEVILE
ncbi:MAG: biotin--[acetyl-CoA-carboxylase] ligase [Spirochaetes bacterium]|nr:biotin--[acetyl-CoA-carboxylase] ligase [Spirochaetota bacterium]